jgi:hypothetical protein
MRTSRARTRELSRSAKLLTLPLLVLGILANDHHTALALDDLALLTDWFYRCSYFHCRLISAPASLGEQSSLRRSLLFILHSRNRANNYYTTFPRIYQRFIVIPKNQIKPTTGLSR